MNCNNGCNGNNLCWLLLLLILLGGCGFGQLGCGGSCGGNCGGGCGGSGSGCSCGGCSC